MARSKIAVSLDEQTLRQLDRLVAEAIFPSHSQAIQVAVQETLARLNQSRLARECAKLDPAFDKELAEKGLAAEASAWPDDRVACPQWGHGYRHYL